MVITAQLHSTKPELRFGAGSSPVRGMSEIRDGEDLWQWSQLEISLNTFRQSTIAQEQFIIINIKKVTQIKWHHQLECNCCIKTKCPLNGDCRKENVIYECTALTTFQSKKCILALQRMSLKTKDIITTPNHFETRTIWTAQLFLFLFGK